MLPNHSRRLSPRPLVELEGGSHPKPTQIAEAHGLAVTTRSDSSVLRFLERHQEFSPHSWFGRPSSDFTSRLVEKSFEYAIPDYGTTSVIRIAFLKNGRMMADVVLVRCEQQANPTGV